MASSLEQYRETLKKIQQRENELREFENAKPENQEPSDLDLAMEESSDLESKLKALTGEAKVNKLARKLDEDENSSFNLSKKFDSPEDIYEDVVGQFRPDPEVSESGEPVLTPEELAAGPELPQAEPVREPADLVADEMADAEMSEPSIEPQPMEEQEDVEPEVPVAPKVDVMERLAALRPQPKVDSDKEAMKEAYKRQDLLNALANITRGADRASRAAAGGALARIAESGDVGRAFAEAGKSEVAREKELQGIAEKKRKEALQDKLANMRLLTAQSQLQKSMGQGVSNDPNSEESKAAQEQAMALMGTLGIKYDPEKIRKLNAATIGSKNFTAGLRKSVNKLSEKRLESTETERFNKWTEKKEDDLTKAIQNFNKDKEVVRSNSMISGAKIARDMVESGNPVAAASIPNFLARASGEVGALTEADKEPFGGSRAIVERSKQAVQQMIDGTLTEANKRFVLELSKVYEKTARGVLNERADIRARQLGGIDFPVEMLRGRFMGTDRAEFTKQALPVTRRTLSAKDKAAYDWAKDNETDPRAKRILRKLGME